MTRLDDLRVRWNELLDRVDAVAEHEAQAVLVDLVRTEKALHAELHARFPGAWFNAQRQA